MQDLRAPGNPMGLPRRFLGCMIIGIWFLCRILLIVWATLAIYYSNLPRPELRLGLAVAFAAFSFWALWFSQRRRMSVAFVVLFLGVVAWWISIPPLQNRNWRPITCACTMEKMSATASSPAPVMNVNVIRDPSGDRVVC